MYKKRKLENCTYEHVDKLPLSRIVKFLLSSPFYTILLRFGDDTTTHYACSSHLREFLGLSCEDICGKPSHDLPLFFYEQDDIPVNLTLFSCSIKPLKDVYVIKPDGEKVSGTLRIISYQEQDNSSYSLVEFITTSTMCLLNQTLEAHITQYENFLHKAPMGVLLTKGYTYHYVNRYFLDMLGYDSPDELIGTSCQYEIPFKYREEVETQRLLAESGEATSLIKSAILRKDRTICYDEFIVFPIEINGERFLQVFIRDISHEMDAWKKVEEQKEVLKQQNNDLNNKNIALTEVINSIESEKTRIKNEILCNVRDSIFPLIQRLKNGTSDEQLPVFELLESKLQNITESFGLQLHEMNHSLSPKELEIAHYIRQGLSSKEMSELLHVGISTIDSHRKNIRKKLGLTGSNNNLTNYLKNLTL